MISSTLCLYLGSEDSLYQRYPRDIFVTAYSDFDEQALEEKIAEVVSRYSLQEKNEIHETTLQISGVLNGNRLQFEQDSLVDYDDIATVKIFTLEEYNRLAGTSETLQDGEVLLSVIDGSYSGDTIQIGTMQPFQIQKQVPPERRQNLHFLADEAGTIFAEFLGVAARVAPTAETTHVLELEIIQEQTRLEQLPESSLGLPRKTENGETSLKEWSEQFDTKEK